MSEPSTPSGKLQWKWIGISLVLYAVFYLLPIIVSATRAEVFAFVWMFAGVIIVAAVTGCLSEGVTILEPAIAGAGLMFLFFITMMVLIPRQINITGAVIGMVILMVGVFALSLLGAWFGERAQQLWRSKPSEKTEGH